MTTPADLLATWRDRAALFRRFGASELVAAADMFVEELESVVGTTACPDAGPPGQGSAAPTPSSSSWRDRLWTVPAATRLGVREVVEATGRSRGWVYSHTAPGGTTRRLPHRKLDGQLVFLAGELRDWLGSAESVVEPAVRRLHATR